MLPRGFEDINLLLWLEVSGPQGNCWFPLPTCLALRFHMAMTIFLNLKSTLLHRCSGRKYLVHDLIMIFVFRRWGRPLSADDVMHAGRIKRLRINIHAGFAI